MNTAGNKTTAITEDKYLKKKTITNKYTTKCSSSSGLNGIRINWPLKYFSIGQFARIVKFADRIAHFKDSNQFAGPCTFSVGPYEFFSALSLRRVRPGSYETLSAVCKETLRLNVQKI